MSKGLHLVVLLGFNRFMLSMILQRATDGQKRVYCFISITRYIETKKAQAVSIVQTTAKTSTWTTNTTRIRIIPNFQIGSLLAIRQWTANYVSVLSYWVTVRSAFKGQSTGYHSVPRSNFWWLTDVEHFDPAQRFDGHLYIAPSQIYYIILTS